MHCIVFTVILAVVAAQQHGHNDHHANQHAIHEQLIHVFQSMDTNRDGGVSEGEDLAFFDKGDANGDGNMTFEEFHANRQHPHGPVHTTEQQERLAFNFYDTRGGTQAADGVIARDDVAYFFQLVDMNGDGHFSLQEFEATVAKLAAAMASGATLPPPTTAAAPTTV